MDHIRISQLKTRVSLVVCVSDSLTSYAPLGNSTSVHLEGTRSAAIRKPNGSFIFNDITPGDYQLKISNENYFDEQRLITVGTDNLIIFVQMQPLPSYPFPQGTGLIRFLLRNAEGAPLSNAGLLAMIVTEECARARLMMDQADQGSDEIALGSMTGVIAVGDTYLLRGRGPKAPAEHIRIAEVLEHQKRFRLEQKLAKTFGRGSLLLPVQGSRVTERGEAVIAFRGNRVPAFQTEIVITYGNGRRHEMKEIAMTDGATTNLGVIRLT